MIRNQNISWRRVSVEVVAIVGGILLAFAIDAWWDERIERLEEKEILQSLHAEFLSNRAEAAAVIRTHEAGLQSTTQLMMLTDEQILELSTEEVEVFMRYMANPHTFDAVRGSVDVLTSSGKLGILQNRELRQALTTFVNILEDAVEDRQYMFQWAMTVWRETARNGGPFQKRATSLSVERCAELPEDAGCYISGSLAYLPAATPQDLLRLRKNATLMGYVNGSRETSIRYASEVRDAQAQIEHILTLLEESL